MVSGRTSSQTASLLRTNAVACADFFKDKTRNHVTRRQFFHARRMAFHKALALGVEQNATFAACRFGNQNAFFVNARRMELEKFHVFQRNPAPPCHRHKVACQRVRVRSDFENFAESARRNNDGLGVENVDFACRNFDRDTAATLAVFHNQVEHLKPSRRLLAAPVSDLCEDPR